MAEDKLEFIIRKEKNTDIDINSMSIETTKAFMVLVSSICSIVEQTRNKKGIKIQIKEGSACVIAKGQAIKNVKTNFETVISNKSRNVELVKSWRNIQNLFIENGLTYEANFRNSTTVTPIYDLLISSKKITKKRIPNQPIKTNIKFIEGSLIAVGGKTANIHIENRDFKDGRLIISCSRNQANKAKAFLYKRILLSIRIAEKDRTTNYELCDSYFESQEDFYNNLKSFVNSFESEENEIEQLKLLHYKCREFLDGKDYGNFRKFLRLFNSDSVDINILHTLLVVTQAFKENEDLGLIRQSIKNIFDNKVRIYKRKHKLIEPQKQS